MIKITEMPDGRNRKVSDSSHQVNDHEKQMRNDRRRGKRMLMSPVGFAASLSRPSRKYIPFKTDG